MTIPSHPWRVLKNLPTPVHQRLFLQQIGEYAAFIRGKLSKKTQDSIGQPLNAISRCLELETTVGAAEAEFGISCLVFRTVLSQAWNSHCRTNRSWQMGIEATRLLMEATVPEPNIAILRSRFFQFEKRYSAMADMLIVCRLSDANKISPLDYVSWMAAEERQEAYFAIRWDVLLDLKREPSASKPPAPPPSGP